MFTLRPYQQQAVDGAVAHFKAARTPAVIVLPTGAGKSIVIAELSRIAKGRVLVLAHVRELVEQNHSKFESLGFKAGIFSAGLSKKETEHKVIFGSIQSVARAVDTFFNNFSIVIIDECHRISVQQENSENESQYFQVISKLKENNKDLCILGLTATPYRLGYGWIYQYHVQKKLLVTNQDRFFEKCVFELSLRYMIENNFLTVPVQIDSPVACYDFSSLRINGTAFVASHIEELLRDQKRITPAIIKNIIEMSEKRLGVMIFTTSIKHAEEILEQLPKNKSALVIGDTETTERDLIISNFKKQKIKYLVNVSVLTTGFDAPHVDVIAILRPTESVSLYQQIVGRGLRLSPNKADCLILDYTGQSHDIYQPDIEDDKPTSNSVIVDVECPKCLTLNQFWGLKNSDGFIVEHFGRQCKAAFENAESKKINECGFLFRFKRCDKCSAENDISARQCKSCQHLLVDNDKKLKDAMALKDAHVMRVDSMQFVISLDKNKNERLEIQYCDHDANILKEYFYLNSKESQKAFYYNFMRMHLRVPEQKIVITDCTAALQNKFKFRQPTYVIARKEKYFWSIREKIFY